MDEQGVIEFLVGIIEQNPQIQYEKLRWKVVTRDELQNGTTSLGWSQEIARVDSIMELIWAPISYWVQIFQRTIQMSPFQVGQISKGNVTKNKYDDVHERERTVFKHRKREWRKIKKRRINAKEEQGGLKISIDIDKQQQELLKERDVEVLENLDFFGNGYLSIRSKQ